MIQSEVKKTQKNFPKNGKNREFRKIKTYGNPEYSISDTCIASLVSTKSICNGLSVLRLLVTCCFQNTRIVSINCASLLSLLCGVVHVYQFMFLELKTQKRIGDYIFFPTRNEEGCLNQPSFPLKVSEYFIFLKSKNAVFFFT